MPEKAKPPPNESVTYSSGAHDGPPDLRLLHYNDVYHVDSSSAEPVGGAARFMTLVKQYREDAKWKGHPNLITLFSGDAFNPSLESSITKGMCCLVPFGQRSYPNRRLKRPLPTLRLILSRH
jgi:5'-nucleotidase